jgi:hypothetical protein
MSEFLSEDMLEQHPYRGPVVLALFTAALFLPGLGARDFWAPGEPIYGEIIRVMHERNDWLVPMVNGQLYADKPILYFWLALTNCFQNRRQRKRVDSAVARGRGGIGVGADHLSIGPNVL